MSKESKLREYFDYVTSREGKKFVKKNGLPVSEVTINYELQQGSEKIRIFPSVYLMRWESAENQSVLLNVDRTNPEKIKELSFPRNWIRTESNIFIPCQWRYYPSCSTGVEYLNIPLDKFLKRDFLRVPFEDREVGIDKLGQQIYFV